MKYLVSPSRSVVSTTFFLTILIGLATLATTGCGTSSTSPQEPVFSGNTSLHFVLSSAADDRFNRFDLDLQSLTLTDQAGKKVYLISADQGLEFIHVNSAIEPWLNVDIPQQIYTEASATVGTAEFSCVTRTPTGGIDVSTFAYGQTPNEDVTVNLPSPLTITGKNMALVLELQVSKSADLSSCYNQDNQYTYSISPTFDLMPLNLASSPSNSSNGKVSALDGEVTSIDTAANSFQIALPQDFYFDPISVQIKTDSNTIYQGVGSISDLSVGSLLDLDGKLQADGSLIATRIAVPDTDTSNLSMQTGPIIQNNGSEPLLLAFGRRQQGYFYDTQRAGIWTPFDYGSSLFQISGQFPNLQDLPFVASFNATNIVDGQNVYVTTHSQTVTSHPYPQAASITLFPQTITGSVVASSQIGTFTEYTVTLAPDALFPTLAVQSGQPTRLDNPDIVNVYVDANTQKLNTSSLVPGNTLRFYGLVFNDNGTLRMDCAEVRDGVASSSSNNLKPGYAQTTGGRTGSNAVTTTVRSR